MHKHFTVLVVCACCTVIFLMFTTGCSDQPKDSWAQDSRDYRSDRDAYIGVQTEHGVDPARARQLYDANVWKLNTEGIDPASVYQAPEQR